MSRFAVQTLLAVGVVIASAIFDFGSRADAAYLSSVQPCSMCPRASQGDDSKPSTPTRVTRTLFVAVELPGGGGMSSAGSSPTSGPAASAGLTSQTRPVSDDLVAYFRESPASLHSSAFIDSILDPPRLA